MTKFPIVVFGIVAIVVGVMFAFSFSSDSSVDQAQLEAELGSLSDEELAVFASGDSNAMAGLAVKSGVSKAVAHAPRRQVAAAAAAVQARTRSVSVKKSSAVQDAVAANNQVRNQAGQAGYGIASQNREQAMSAAWSGFRLSESDRSKTLVVSNTLNLGCIQLQSELEKQLGATFVTEIRDMPVSCFNEDIMRDQLFYQYCDEVTSLQAKDGTSMPGWVPAQKIARQTACLSEKQTAKLSAALRDGTNAVLGTLRGFGYENAQGNFLNLMMPAYLLVYDVDKHRGKDSGLYQLFKQHKQLLKDTVRTKGWATEKMMFYDRASGQLVGARVCKGNENSNCVNGMTLLNSLRPGTLNDGHCPLGAMVAQGSKMIPETGEEAFTCPTSPCGMDMMNPAGAGARGGAGPGKQAGAAKGPGIEQGLTGLNGQWGAESTGTEQSMAASLCGSLANPANSGFAGMGVFGNDACMGSSVFPSDADIAAGRVQNGANAQRNQMVACIGASDAREQAAGQGALQPGQRRDTMSLQRGNPMSGGCGLAGETHEGRTKLNNKGGTTKVNEYYGDTMDATITITTKLNDKGDVESVNAHTIETHRKEDGSETKESHTSTYDREGKCTGGCNEPVISETEADDAVKEAEDLAKGTGATSCANPESCSSSCTGANEQATFSGDCMGSEVASQHPAFAGAQQGPGRAGPVVNPGREGNGGQVPRDPAAAASGVCRAMNSGSDNVCAQVMCGESSNMAANTGAANIGGMAVKIDGGRGEGSGDGNGGGRGGPADSVRVSGGDSGARAQGFLNSLACCGLSGANLQRQITMNRGCAVMRCADDTGDCSCTASGADAGATPGREGGSGGLGGGAGGGLGGEDGPQAGRAAAGR